jgi:hypothetical protein
VPLVLPEDGALRTDLLHVSQTHDLQWLLMDEAQLLLLRDGPGIACRKRGFGFLRVCAAVLAQVVLLVIGQPSGRYYLIDNFLLRLIAAGILMFLNVGDFKRLILGVVLLPIDELDEGDVLGKLGDVVAAEEDDDVVLGTLQPVLLVVLDDERVQTTVAVGVTAGRQQTRHVVAAVLVAAQRTVEVALH